MQVNGISSANATTSTSTKKRSVLNTKSTGYVAAAGMALAVLSGPTKSKFLRNNHKVFAGISLVAVIAHMYLVSSNRNHWKKSVSSPVVK